MRLPIKIWREIAERVVVSSLDHRLMQNLRIATV
jgi:hypothetical protein